MRLKKIRIIADLKQSEVAEILHVSKSTYGIWEQERDIIPLKHLNDFCNHFHVSLDYILELSDTNNFICLREKIDTKLLAKRLKLIRKLNDETQEELAKKVNIARTSISKYEHAINTPLTTYLIGFCKHFKVSCDYLVGKTDEEKSLLAII